MINIQNIATQEWTNIGIMLALFVILVIAGFFIIRFLYIRKQENYLFKNKNNLYNLMNYIQKSKKQGKTNAEIYRQLKKIGWDSAQARYAIDKYKREN
jgi:hypothetical protein